MINYESRLMIGNLLVQSTNIKIESSDGDEIGQNFDNGQILHGAANQKEIIDEVIVN